MISDRIRANFIRNSEKPFLVKDDSSVHSYAGIAESAVETARTIPENSVAAVLVGDPANMMPAILACWLRNTIPAILEPQIKDDKLGIIREITGFKFILTDQKPQEFFGKNVIRVENPDSKGFNPENPEFSIRISDDSPALLLFTSGSTGIPKCVPLSLSNIWSNIEDFSGIVGMDGNDVFLSTSPLFYAHALYNSFLTSLLLGGKVIYAGVLNLMNAANTVRLANIHKATVYNLTPSMMQILLMLAGRFKEPFPGFRHIICGTARLDPDLKKKFETAFNCIVTQQYGMTETLFITVNDRKQIESPESVGIPVACEIRITDENGKKVPEGQSGDISIKSKSSFGSYFNQPDETGKSYLDGWFFTGDEGKIGPDGYLTVTGRKKEIIKKGGYNINPNEINDVLNKFGGVSDSATISLQDPVYGEEIFSFVTGNGLSEPGILDFCREKLPKTHLPRKIFVVSKIPKTANGKTDMPELRRLAEEKLEISLKNDN